MCAVVLAKEVLSWAVVVGYEEHDTHGGVSAMDSEQASVMGNHRRRLYAANGDCEGNKLEYQQEE